MNELIDELMLREKIYIKYYGIKNYWLDTLNMPILIADAIYDTINSLKTEAFLFYEKKYIRAIIQPVAKFGKNNIWPKRQWQNIIAAEYGRAFIMLYNKNFYFILGRENFAVGPSRRNNLLLSGRSPPMDGIFTSYENEKFKISYLFSRLSNIKDENLKFNGDTIHTDTIDAKRFFVLHRLDYKPNHWLNIGFNETVIFGGEEIPDFYYLNPLVSAIPLELTREGANHNVFWEGDIRLQFKNMAIYGELLIDDFQYLPDQNNEPNHCGILLGTQIVKNKNFIQFEYTRVSSWTYNHFFTWQRYEQLGYPIGHPIGCDFDEIFTKITHHMNKSLDLFIKLVYTRKGANNMNTLWPIPEAPRKENTYFPNINFLMPPVNKYFDFMFGINIYLKFLYSVLEAGVSNKKPAIKCYIRFNK